MHLLTLSLYVIRHPIDSFRLITKERDKFSFLPAVILLVLMVLVRLLNIQWMHFPLQQRDPNTADWLLETALLLVPVLSVSICTFAITSILDGQMMMREALTSMAYAMMPYIVFTLPLTLLSHLLGQGDQIFAFLQMSIYVWCVVLYIISVYVMNDYTFAKTLLVILLSVLLMALMWAMCLLVLALWNQLKEFVISFVRELRYTLSR